MDPASIFPAGTAPAQPKAYVDVTEATFEAEVLDRSEQVPVVLDFWAEWCAPCRQLGPVLERLAAEADGAWVLAKIDVDANPRLSDAAQVRGIPAVKAVVGRALVGEFTGALPEPQVRSWLTQLLAVAQEAGLAGEGAAAQADPEPEPAPAAEPVTEAAAEPEPAPDEPELAAAAAEFPALLAAVRSSEGDERDAARQRLVALFERFPDGDERVAAARRDLAAALF